MSISPKSSLLPPLAPVSAGLTEAAAAVETLEIELQGPNPIVPGFVLVGELCMLAAH